MLLLEQCFFNFDHKDMFVLSFLSAPCSNPKIQYNCGPGIPRTQDYESSGYKGSAPELLIRSSWGAIDYKHVTSEYLPAIADVPLFYNFLSVF